MSGINDQFKSASENLSRLVKKTTEVVSQRWDELSAIQQRRREMWEMARERKRLMAEMGAKVYSLHRRGKVQNRDLLADCERIDAIGRGIAQREREIEELQRTRSAAEPTPVEVEDDTTVVADEDIDAEAAEPAEEPAPEAEPEVEEEEIPEEQADVSTDEEADEGPTMIPVEVEEEAGDQPEVEADEMEPEVDKEGAEPCAHAHDPVEGSREGDDQDPQSPECEW